MRSEVMETKLDHKLDCKRCGVIALEIPNNAVEDTPIRCSICGDVMGMWGQIQNDFYKQAAHGVFNLDRGNITKC
jgi:transcription elongation factor Elf1